MPEVIEIRKYADFLKKIIKNKYLNELNILKGRYTKKPFEQMCCSRSWVDSRQDNEAVVQRQRFTFTSSGW